MGARDLAIDLRSDTVTQPPIGMRGAIAAALVGDDGYREDPTVNELESTAARLLGKDAALLVSSGTMANLVAIVAQCGRGRSILVGDLSDIWTFEAGGASLVGGLVYRPVPTQPDGTLTTDDLSAAIDLAEQSPYAAASLICLENTHATYGGCVLTPAYVERVHAFAARRGLRVHVDGARLFNAAVALGVDVRSLAAHADTVAFCLSKGLSAPVGSIVAGGRGTIARARTIRKALGGEMRQAGFVAAAGLYALRHMVDRLADDHVHARILAGALSRVDGISLVNPTPQTNIVIWRVTQPGVTPRALVRTLRRRGVGVLALANGCVRAVTHFGITADDVGRAAAIVGEVLLEASHLTPEGAAEPLTARA